MSDIADVLSSNALSSTSETESLRSLSASLPPSSCSSSKLECECTLCLCRLSSVEFSTMDSFHAVIQART